MASQRGKKYKPKETSNADDNDDQNENQPTCKEDETKLAKIDKKQKKQKALLEFRCMVEDAILGNYLLGKPKIALSASENRKAREKLREITLWGVPLLPSKSHEGTDIVLTKFLKAKGFKVHDAFEMLRKTLKWRREYNVDSVLEETSEVDVEKLVCIGSRDNEGHPLYFNVYAALKDKNLYNELFGSQENCEQFLRLRVRYMEKGIRLLNFKAGGTDALVQITDLKNLPGSTMKELRLVTKKCMMLLQNYYPELIYRDIIVNAPFWYYASHVLSSKLLSQRTKKKFVFARPNKVTKTLLKFIAPEYLPAEYGGLKRENDDEFCPEDKVLELNVKKNSTSSIQIPVAEVGVTMIWDVTVVGWEVLYREEFIPEDEGSYNVLLNNEKEKKGIESIRNSFYIGEPGNIVITIQTGYKKKRVFL